MSAETYCPCQVPGCEVLHPDDRVMCDRCWNLLEPEHREAILLAYLDMRLWRPFADKVLERAVEVAVRQARRVRERMRRGRSRVDAMSDVRFVMRCTRLCLQEM